MWMGFETTGTRFTASYTIERMRRFGLVRLLYLGTVAMPQPGARHSPDPSMDMMAASS
jgi:hypothetical protein